MACCDAVNAPTFVAVNHHCSCSTRHVFYSERFHNTTACCFGGLFCYISASCSEGRTCGNFSFRLCVLNFLLLIGVRRRTTECTSRCRLCFATLPGRLLLRKVPLEMPCLVELKTHALAVLMARPCHSAARRERSALAP